MGGKTAADFAKRNQEIKDEINEGLKFSENTNSEKSLSLLELQEQIAFVDEMNISDTQKELIKESLINEKFLDVKSLEKKAFQLRLDIFKQAEIISNVPESIDESISKKRFIEIYEASLKVGYFLRAKKEHLEYDCREVLLGNINSVKSTKFMQAMHNIIYNEGNIYTYNSEVHMLFRSAAAFYATFLMVINDESLQTAFFYDLNFYQD